MNLKQFYDEKVKIVAENGKIFLGKVNDYFYPDENENGKESIVVDTVENQAVEFYEDHIREIKIIK